MIGVEFRSRMSPGLHRLIVDMSLEDTEMFRLIKGVTDLCIKTCVYEAEGAPAPLLDLQLIDTFLKTMEMDLNKHLKNSVALDTGIRALCFHIPAADESSPASIYFYFHESMSAEPSPMTRVICPVVNNIIYH